jgi:thiosulfate dehydrogenase
MSRALAMVVAAAALGCSIPAQEYGALAFHDPTFSGSQFNTWSCHTCHATRAGDPRILTGAPMVGVTSRSGWYGGRAQSLFDAVRYCYVSFMRGARLERDEARSRALYEYLASLKGEPQEALPFTVVGTVADLPRGDHDLGGEVYRRACHDCHGALHTGTGGNTERASVLPEVTQDYAQLFPGVNPAEVVVEKVRHGQFFGVGGNMPLYSREALSDEQLGALLTYLGL